MLCTLGLLACVGVIIWQHLIWPDCNINCTENTEGAELANEGIYQCGGAFSHRCLGVYRAQTSSAASLTFVHFQYMVVVYLCCRPRGFVFRCCHN